MVTYAKATTSSIFMLKSKWQQMQKNPSSSYYDGKSQMNAWAPGWLRALLRWPYLLGAIHHRQQLLTHCGLVTPFDDIDLGQHWLR